MSNERFDPARFVEIQTLRTNLTEDLRAFLAADVHLAGYIVAWLGRNLEVEELEQLVDELDGVYRVAGRSIRHTGGSKK